MSARVLLLAVVLGSAAAMASCSTVVPDSSPGPTLVPLETLPLPASTTAPSVSDADSEAVDDSLPESEDESTTSTTLPPTTTSTSSTSTSTSTTTPASTTTEARISGAVNGVQATIGGRNLSFTSSCRDGLVVKLDGVTWAFGGNSFRLSGDDDVRSEAGLVGDGWTMPMVVASVEAGVYRYVGTPVDGSVASAEVTVDHSALSNC